MPGSLEPLRLEGAVRRPAGEAGRHHEIVFGDAVHDHGHALCRLVHPDNDLGLRRGTLLKRRRTQQWREKDA